MLLIMETAIFSVATDFHDPLCVLPFYFQVHTRVLVIYNNCFQKNPVYVFYHISIGSLRDKRVAVGDP